MKYIKLSYNDIKINLRIVCVTMMQIDSKWLLKPLIIVKAYAIYGMLSSAKETGKVAHLFTDNIVHFSISPFRLGTMTQDLNHNCLEVGLKLKIAKIKLVTNSKHEGLK